MNQDEYLNYIKSQDFTDTYLAALKGTNEEIKYNLVGSGNNTVDVVLYQSGYEYTIYSATDIPYGIREV